MRIKFIVETDGRVREIILTQRTGIVSLDDAYRNMIKQWRFDPMQLGGKNVPSLWELSFKNSMQDSDEDE